MGFVYHCQALELAYPAGKPEPDSGSSYARAKQGTARLLGST
jgi:hypothetical protein